MKVKALKYNIVTGGILSVYNGSKPHLQIKTGQDYYPDKIIVDGEVVHRDISGVSDATHNMDIRDPDNPVPVEKQLLPGTLDKTSIAADGVEEATIAGLPISGGDTWGNITGGGAVESIELFSDGELIITVDSVATYTITLRHPLYLTRTWEVIGT